MKNKKEIKEIERQENLYVKLPNLINKIILESLLPLPVDKEPVLREIEEVKKITNSQCEAILHYLKSLNVDL